MLTTGTPIQTSTALATIPRVFVSGPVGPPVVYQAAQTAVQATVTRSQNATSAQVQSLTAHRQWARRPADERFWSVAECLESARIHRDTAREYALSYRDLDVRAVEVQSARPGFESDLDLRLVSRDGRQAEMTNYCFSQVARVAGAPADYLGTLPTELAAQCIQSGLRQLGSSGAGTAGQLLVHGTNGHTIARALNGSQYSRIFDADLLERVASLPGGWKTPPARPAGIDGERTKIATIADVLAGSRLGPQVGDTIAPAGVYRSDRDLWIFQVDPSRVIETGTGRALMRGYILWNSEIGGKSQGISCFLLDDVCGNHILHGLSVQFEFRVRHVGDAAHRSDRAMRVELARYASMSDEAERRVIQGAQRLMLGTDKPSTVDLLFAKRIAPKGALESAYAIAERNVDSYGPPMSAWAMVNGLTEYSQTTKHTDARMELDRAAGKVLALAS